MRVDGSIWEALSGVGTVGATVVAVWLAGRSLRQERGSIARLVSAWVTVDFRVNDDRRTYRRVTTLHVGNESNESVFEAFVNVIVGAERISLGSLSSPRPIAVLPPRSVREYDISGAITGQLDVSDPRAELSFTAPNDTKWLRTAEGNLEEASNQGTSWKPMPVATPAQIGKEDPTNPKMPVFAFLSAVWEAADAEAEGRASDPALDPFGAVASFAEGWEGADWADIGRQLPPFAPTTFVDYRTEHVAYVKLVGDPEAQGSVVEGPDPIWVKEVRFVTLVLDRSVGWRVFGVGVPVEPEEIQFPEDALRLPAKSEGGLTA
ncbi:hypothetical protein DEI97_006070 [Curtobacterium sp. MCLR17_032]|uniref:hypothetical protein n=1 Tax=Curtobacterium sp. MCLR17_032 TaxID=2175650 RepID=UPI0011B3DEAA|nr:hypothetical protein [Curtobacterium sp. MCLR17_032]WIE62705.1 hypothetical protein DEI97_006070 [Curtobacterium sp. MCLR17_032]